MSFFADDHDLSESVIRIRLGVSPKIQVLVAKNVRRAKKKTIELIQLPLNNWQLPN